MDDNSGWAIGRGGMIQDISTRLTNEFASCLQANMQTAGPSGAAAEGMAASMEGAGAAPAPQPAARAAKPVGGVRLAFWAMWRSIVRFFSRVFGGKEGSGQG